MESLKITSTSSYKIEPIQFRSFLIVPNIIQHLGQALEIYWADLFFSS